MSDAPLTRNDFPRPELRFRRQSEWLAVSFCGFRKGKRRVSSFSEETKRVAALLFSRPRYGRYRNKVFLTRDELVACGFAAECLKADVRQLFHELSSYEIALVNETTEAVTISSLCSGIVLASDESGIEVSFFRGLPAVFREMERARLHPLQRIIGLPRSTNMEALPLFDRGE